jgi:hypothetical protein
MFGTDREPVRTGHEQRTKTARAYDLEQLILDIFLCLA